MPKPANLTKWLTHIPSFYRHYTIAITCFIILTSIAWIYFQPIKTTARTLSPRAIPITVFSNHTLLKKILIKEGDIIQENQPLAIITDTRVAHAYDQGRQQYLALLATISRLQAESRGDPFIIFPKEIKHIPEIVARETAIFNTHRQQQKNNQEQLQHNIALAENQFQTLADLLPESKNLLGTPLQQLHESAMTESQKLKQLAGNSLKSKTRELTDIATILNSEKPYIQNTTIYSPIHGVIEHIFIQNPESTLQTGQTLLTIVPWTPHILFATKLSLKQIQYFHAGEKIFVHIKSKQSNISTQGTIARIQSEHMFIQVSQISSPKNITLAPDEIVTLTIKHHG